MSDSNNTDLLIRSRIMASIRSQNIKPEIIVRKILHKEGYRFRIHHKDLPGNPDIVLPKYKLCIFVHGCFWHFHENCRNGHIPRSIKQYWIPKLEKNISRDKKNQADLLVMGWKVLVLWECHISNDEEFIKVISSYMNSVVRN